MAITLFGVSPNPIDNGSLDNSVKPMAIVPPASMLAGDIAIVFQGGRSGSDVWSVSNNGGQSWNSESLGQAGSLSTQASWCRFNGTWSASPSFTDTNTGLAVSLLMVVFRPTSGSNTWALDTASKNVAFGTPVSPFDVTATPNTPAVASSTVTVAAIMSVDNTGFTLSAASVTAGWANAGSAQYRNLHTADASRQLSITCAYKVMTSAAAIPAVTVTEDSTHVAQGRYMTLTFKEQSAGVTVASVSTGSTPIVNGQTAITVTGTTFGASHTGSADIIISPTDNIADGAAVVQTQTAWADTSVTFTANLSSFSRFTNLYLFVKNSGGSANSSGFVVQRGSVASFAQQLKNVNGSANAANLTGIKYAIYPTTDVLGTAISSGSAATTDASGNIGAVNTYTLVSGGPVSVGDDVVLIAWKGAGSASATAGTIYQLTPTYS